MKGLLFTGGIPLVVLLASCALSQDVNLGDDAINSFGDKDNQPETQFRIARVLKTETEGSFKVTVLYEGTRKPDVNSFDGPFQITKHEHGMVEIDVPKDPRLQHPRVSFFLPDISVTMQLDLNNTADSMVFPHFDFVIGQGGDIKYNPGQPIQFNVTFSIDGDMDNIVSDDVDLQIMISSDTQDNVVDVYDPIESSKAQPVKLVPVDFRGSMGYRYVNFILNSTRENPEGMIGVNYGAHYNSSAKLPVSWLRYHHAVKFYQEGHEGPFPRGFIGFINYTSFDNSHVFCDMDYNDCVLSCEAIGDEVNDIQIRKMTSRGPNPRLSTTTIINGGVASTAVHVRNVTYEDAGYFQCTAKSPTQQIARVLEIEVVRRAMINKELSTATMFKNGTLLVTCTAEGIPAPRVYLTDYFVDTYFRDYYTTHTSQPGTRVDMFIYEFNDHRASFYCRATNTDQEVHDYLEIVYSSH